MNINSLLLALGMFSKSVTLLPNNIKIGEFKSINTRENLMQKLDKQIRYFLGGLFEEANSMEEIAFKYAVDHINRNKLLPKSRVMAQIERIPSHDSFYASKRGLIDQTSDES